MTNELFAYRGPAVVADIDFPDVELHEERDAGDAVLRSWEGETSFLAAEVPTGFTPALMDSDIVTVRLPDGRQGQALVTDLQFDGQAWTMVLQGTGPAPGAGR
ncbi:hypothetical protein [Streptomyces sp. NPDC058280]|uniref:hypothetical protein n=1 Tax=Streptomyces sp. NPDC058280 TaxID=3346419 RepID=UPI0036EC154B